MVMTYRGKPVTDAVIATIEGAGLTVGDGEKPEGAGWQGPEGTSEFAGYVVVHHLDGGVPDGPIDDPDTDATPCYQLSCYGANRAQCDLVADKAHVAMTTGTFTIAGRDVMRVIVDEMPGARRVDDVQPPEWQSSGRYYLMTTPA